MSVESAPGAVTLAPAAGRATRSLRLTPGRLALAGAAVLVLLSLVRVLTGAEDITSGGSLGATINLALPIMLAGLGGLWSERSGVVNIGLEGMMILGTWFGAEFSLAFHTPWMGIVGGLVGGLIGGLIHAVATITFGVDHIVSGVAINILALGAARYLAGLFFSGQKGGGSTQSPGVPTFANFDWHAGDRALGSLEAHHWFVVSDVAGLLRGIVTGLDWFTIVALLTVPLTWFVLWRTPFGLRLRSCGESPAAAESLGVDVYRMKYAAVLVSGALAGLAGAFLVNFTSIYREGQTGGRGYIGLAAMIFGNWRPGGLVAGSALFGYTDALQSRQGSVSVHALLLFVALLLVGVAGWNLFRRRWLVGGSGLLVAVLVLLWFLFTDSLPGQLVTYTPQIVTLLVLSLASQRLRMPAADGLPYRKGQGG